MEQFVLAPGFVLKDRYCLQRVIHQDGTVIDYMAQDTANGARYRVRQVHVVYSDPATSRKHRQSFRETAPQLIGLHHRALAAVVDCFDQGPDFFTVSAWVEGPSLATLAVPVPTDMALKWMMDILDAMELVASHSDRIGLPELSPQTIRVRDNGTIVIGCLHCRDDGTPLRNTPSPFHSDDQGRSFQREAYTLGAISWWLLTGHAPPTCAERRHGDRTLSPPASLPVALARGLLRMMSVDPRRRPSTPAAARQYFLQSGARRDRRVRTRAFYWPVLAGTVATAAVLLLTPVLGDKLRQLREAHHQRSIESMLEAARIEFKQACYKTAVDSFTNARHASNGKLAVEDTLDLVESQRQCWHPAEARKTLETLAQETAGTRYWLELGRVERDLGDVRAAAEAWRRAQAGQPSEPPALSAWYQGEVAMEQHRWLSAEPALRQALGEQTTLLPARIDLGATLRHQRDYAASIQTLEEAQQQSPEDVVASSELGRSLQESGAFSPAIDAWHQALHRAAENDEAWRGLAEAYLAQGQLEDALSAAAQAVRHNPDNGVDLATLGHILALTDRPTYAARVWAVADRACHAVGTHPEAEAQILLDQGLVSESLAVLGQADTSEPLVLAELAQAQLRSQEPAQADTTLRTLQADTFSGSLGDYETGIICLEQGHARESEAALNIALQKRPQEAAYELAMGRCLLALGDYPGGTRVLAHLTMEHPGSSSGLRLLAEAERHQKQFELSALHLQKICILDGRVERWQEAGQRWIEAQAFDKALECFVMGFRQHPTEPRFNFWLGQCFEALGHPSQASVDYKRYLHGAPVGPMADQARQRLAVLHTRLYPAPAHHRDRDVTPGKSVWHRT